jgi:hypothetical protein
LTALGRGAGAGAGCGGLAGVAAVFGFGAGVAAGCTITEDVALGLFIVWATNTDLQPRHSMDCPDMSDADLTIRPHSGQKYLKIAMGLASPEQVS